jgi:thioredoxin reductase (NADPH)
MYDLIIIGGGPAGIAAGIYASRYGLKTILFSDIIGGEIALSSIIENYPGFDKISGAELAKKWEEHLKSAGAEIQHAKVNEISKTSDVFKVKAGKDQIESKSIILAVGMERRKLRVPGEKEFKGKGVAYCATCDGPLFRGKTVVVVGGGNAGVESTLYFSEIAKQVYLIEMAEQLPAAQSLVNQLQKKENVQIILGNKINEIKGEAIVKSIILDEEYQGKKELSCDGVFIEIGSIPNPSLAKSAGVETDEKGFIKVGADQATNITGLFAAGDATTNSNFFLQALTAMSEGAIAANSVNKYLKKKV